MHVLMHRMPMRPCCTKRTWLCVCVCAHATPWLGQVASKKRQHKALPSASSTPPSVQAAVAAKTQQLATPATAPLVPVTPQKGPTALAKEVSTASPCKVKKHGQNNKQQKRQKLKLKCSKKHGNRRGKKQGKKQKPQKGVKQLKQPTEKPQQDEVAKGLFIPAASPPKAGPPKRMPSSLALPEPAPLVRGGRIRLLSEEERERIRSMTAPSDMLFENASSTARR